MKQHVTIQEIEIHYSRPPLEEMKIVTTSKSAEELLRQFVDKKRIDYKEFFWVMLLSASQHLLGIAEISVGGTTETVVNTKEIFQLALKTNAVKIILCHNHPSGRLVPSSQDISISASLHTFGKMVGISIIDHIILTSESYYSLADNGQI
ncbi:MAG: hypothetical protein POELPBGB_02928 [Bacteroidia bacterium]|nr:hypothetical protein [Bacteroidia bacterium]